MIYFDRKNFLYRSTLLDEFEIIHGFGTRQFGDGRDISILEKYLQQEAITYKSIVVPKQTHSDNVYICRDVINHVSTPENVDGIISATPASVVSVVTADCVPIIFYDPVKQIIAISHQGWKGTLKKLPREVIVKMKSEGSKPKDIRCIFGPAINECCYEVYGERERLFVGEFGNHIICRGLPWQAPTVSLYKANRLTLIDASISPNNIDIFPFCTSCNDDQFFSYHRDGMIAGETLSFVGLF